MSHIQLPNVVELTLSLCRIQSDTGKEAEVVNYIDSICQSIGLVTKRQQVDNIKGRDNLFAFCSKKSPSILLSTHLDTVPPFISPSLSQDQKTLHGRGVCDAKGIAAAMICAVKELLENGIKDVGLLFVVGEETNSDGAKAAASGFVPNVNYIINGEPTDLKLASSMKGALVFELETKGKAGHSAYPESGFSALHRLNEDIHRILNHPWPVHEQFGPTTVNIGRMEGGVAPNVIAEHASAKGIMRTTEDAKQLEEILQKCISSQTQLKVLSRSSPFNLFTVDGFETCVVSFGSDVPHLKKLGMPLLIGPGSILKAHADDESIETDQLYQAVETYKNLCLKLL